MPAGRASPGQMVFRSGGGRYVCLGNKILFTSGGGSYSIHQQAKFCLEGTSVHQEGKFCLVPSTTILDQNLVKNCRRRDEAREDRGIF